MVSDVEGAHDLAREASHLLLRLSAYDYAYAGTLAGAKTHIVSTERYAAVMRDSAATIQRFTGNALNATLTSTGPLKDRLVKLADGLVEVARAATRYADGGDPAVFAEMVGRVRQGWEDVHALARLVRPVDQDLLDTIERGSSFVVGATAENVYFLTVGPFGTAAEANEAAKRIGGVETVSTEAPFVVRVGTYADKSAGEAQVTALSVKGFTGLLAEEQRFKFTRGGPTPEAELWREPERIFETWGGARRVAVASGAEWLVTGSDDGTIAVFSAEGRLLALPRLDAGIAQLALSDDGKWLMAGGITLVNFTIPQGLTVGARLKMPSPTADLAYVPGAAYFAAISGADGQGNGALAARWPDGAHMPYPFTIQLPSSGGHLAVTGAGVLYYASTQAGTTEIDIVDVSKLWGVQGVLRLPGLVRELAVSRDGTHGAVMTENGVFRFGATSPDPARSLIRVGDPVRKMAIDDDGTLYLLTQNKLTAMRGSETKWSAAIVDGRELVLAARPVVLDGADRVLTFTDKGIAEDLGSTGIVVDIAASPDRKHVAVLVDGVRAEVFRLP